MIVVKVIESEALLNEFHRYNKLKIDLLKISHCIHCSTKKSEQEFYKNIAYEYSKELKKLAKLLEQKYGIKFYNSYCNLDNT